MMDTGTRHLVADGIPVPIGATAFAVLLALVERAGDVVGKDDLIFKVWGHSDVGENRLQVHINGLRKILGRGSIVTKHRSGYRFAAQVRLEPSPEQRSRQKRVGNLPLLWTVSEGRARLIGRAPQLRAVAGLLRQARLVSLTGPGGVGKTRLAVQAANESSSRFPDGVWLVELAPLKNPDLVPGAIAAALGITVGQNAPAIDAIARQLARRKLLIVLDNCEHHIGAAANLCGALLGAVPDLKILATSREPLSVSGEQIFEVPPLDVPRDDSQLGSAARETGSIELFIEHASAASANFQMRDEDLPIAARICRQLDGLPLAIEMVASWAGVFGVRELEAEFRGPTTAWVRAANSTAARHLTLRATLQWGYDLLSTTEQIVLRRLAVFTGGFTLGAAKAVAGGDGIPAADVFQNLGGLIRKSMVATVPGVQRYRLLETTRAFLLEKLAQSGEMEALCRRHAAFVLGELESAEDELETAGDAAWLRRYVPLFDDVRSAFDWAIGQSPADAVALAGASWPLWREASMRTEGGRRLSVAAERLTPDTPPLLEAQLRRGLGSARMNTPDILSAYPDITRAIDIYRARGERPRLGRALLDLGYTQLLLGRIDDADQTISEAQEILEQLQWPRSLAQAFTVRLCIESSRGRFEAARSAAEKAIRLCEIAGADRPGFLVNPFEDYTIGCRIVTQPVFLPPERWIPQPPNWAKSIVVGKAYSTDTTEGRALWEAITSTDLAIPKTMPGFGEEQARYGEPVLVKPRLGQGAFRIVVTDAYARACAVSGGKVLPALDAAHIRPYASGGSHEVSNGLLLRRDIHSVFDAGYVTIDEKLRFVVSDRVRTDFNNGNEYRRLHGTVVSAPAQVSFRPDRDALRWHNEKVFLS